MDVRIGKLTVEIAAARLIHVLDVLCTNQKTKKRNHIIRGRTKYEYNRESKPIADY